LFDREDIQALLGHKWAEIAARHGVDLDSPLGKEIGWMLAGLNVIENQQRVYVYGSSLSPGYNPGSARLARRLGAKLDVVEGMDGPCYALPVATAGGHQRPPEEVLAVMKRFRAFARANPQMLFFVGSLDFGWGTPFMPATIGPTFQRPPGNITFDERWWKYIDWKT